MPSARSIRNTELNFPGHGTGVCVCKTTSLSELITRICHVNDGLRSICFQVSVHKNHFTRVMIVANALCLNSINGSLRLPRAAATFFLSAPAELLSFPGGRPSNVELPTQSSRRLSVVLWQAG